ncbi:MAG: hypothetical protein C0403_17105 [Desulfobacterium sp.]|nr:hypothetical protein [Desulfobacterium sp.]
MTYSFAGLIIQIVSSKALIENHQHRDCIILFMRVPEVGKVKTRLSKKLAPKTILDLYQCFVLDILHTAQKTKIHIRIFFHPAGFEASLSQWLGDSYDFHLQDGKDLGIRMANAFIRTFSSGYDRAILIGTDCPEMTVEILEESFYGINQTGCVIGPAVDGGYYLIGFKADSFTEKPFHNVEWGKAIVYQQTLDRCHQINIKPYILQPLNDIDTWDDLQLFYQHHHGKNFSDSHTIRYLVVNKILDALPKKPNQDSL